MKTYQLLFILPALFLISCKNKGDDPAPAFSISQQWYSVKAFSNDTVKVKDGYLYMSTKYGSGTVGRGSTSVGTFKRLKGDFELRIKFSNVIMTGTDLSETVGFALFQDGADPAVLAGQVSNQTIMVSEPSTFPDVQPRTTNDGEFYVKRVGGNYTSWIKVGDNTSSLNKTDYFTGDLGVSMYIFSEDETATRTSVHIDDVIITDGGGKVVSDTFDKNNIYPL